MTKQAVRISGGKERREYWFNQSVTQPESSMDGIYKNANGKCSIDYKSSSDDMQNIIEDLLAIPGVFYVGFCGTSIVEINLRKDFDWTSVHPQSRDSATIEQKIAKVLSKHVGCEAAEILAAPQRSLC